MIPELRNWYNSNFTSERHQKMLSELHQMFDHVPAFRIAETPFFIPKILRTRLLEACNEINEVINQPDFKIKSQSALYSDEVAVPNEDDHTIFLQMDFAVCLDEKGDPIPQLIEIQGFPSVYFFQYVLSELFKKYFDIPEGFNTSPSGISPDEYVDMLREIIVGDENPRHVVLLEIEPEQQNTQVDFWATRHYLGIKVLCLSKMKKDGRRLYYIDEDGSEVDIRRIYNRVIFDELDQRPDLPREFDFRDDVDVKWIGHPNWFYRISKHTLPLLKSKYVPECYYLSDLESYPADLSQFVLKPLFSFSGAGVEIDVTPEMCDAITDRKNYILQKKVNYEPVIQSPNDPVKVEIRMLMLWKEGDKHPRIVNNLSRLSKGKMIGVKYNKDKDWVGGSVGFFDLRP